MAWTDAAGIAAVLLLVGANGFFVAAEFSLVAVRRSRVAELVAKKRTNAAALLKAVDGLDAYLAATQLGITISSLALGWVGEPALAHLIEPMLAFLPDTIQSVGAHAIAVTIAFIIITSLHIVLGELAPKSLALQRSEQTALVIVRPLMVFLVILRPAILFLNGLGNMVLRLCGLKPGTGEESLHSPEELKLLVSASQEAGLLEDAQREVVSRVLGLGERRVGDVMTPRLDIDWIDVNDPIEAQLRTVYDSRHELVLIARGSLDDPLGLIFQQDLLAQYLDGQTPNLETIIRQPITLHEATPVLLALEEFKKAPVRLAMVVDEYGTVEGILTQTDLLEAIAGDIPDTKGDRTTIVEEGEDVYLIDGLTPAVDVYDLLGLEDGTDDDFHTLAGFVLSHLGRIPSVADSFSHGGWTFEVVQMDERRVAYVRVRREVAGDEAE